MRDLIETTAALGMPAPQHGGWVLVPRTIRDRLTMWWHARMGRARFVGRTDRGWPEYAVSLELLQAARRS